MKKLVKISLIYSNGINILKPTEDFALCELARWGESRTKRGRNLVMKKGRKLSGTCFQEQEEAANSPEGPVQRRIWRCESGCPCASSPQRGAQSQHRAGRLRAPRTHTLHNCRPSPRSADLRPQPETSWENNPGGGAGQVRSIWSLCWAAPSDQLNADTGRVTK